MKNKFYKKLNNLSPISVKILKYGMFISCAVMIFALALYFDNTTSENYSISKKTLSFLLADSALAITAEVIIGALLFDYFSKR